MMDFSKMKWRVDQVEPDKDIRVYFPELKETLIEHTNKIEALGISMNIFLRYCVLCYHENSPFVETIEDIVVRKRKVLMALNQDSNDHILLKPIAKEIAYAVLQFLKFENSGKHKKLMMYQEAQSKNYIDLLEGSVNERTKIPDLIESVDKLIRGLSASYAKGDAELENFTESFEIVGNRKVFPEEQ